MRGFKPDEQRQAGGNMGRDAVMAAIAKQSGRTPEPDRPKPEFSPMQSLRQVFSGTIFDPRSRQNKRERDAGYADGGRVRPRGFDQAAPGCVRARQGKRTTHGGGARLSGAGARKARWRLRFDIQPKEQLGAACWRGWIARRTSGSRQPASSVYRQRHEPVERAASSQTTTAWFRVTGTRRRVCRQPRQIGNCLA